MQVEDIEYIYVQQFRHAERWCINYIHLIFEGKTKEYGEIGHADTLMKDNKIYRFR